MSLSEPPTPLKTSRSKSPGRSPAVNRKSWTSDDRPTTKDTKTPSKDKKKRKKEQKNDSESDETESDSMESEQTTSQDSQGPKTPKSRKGSSHWEMLEGLREGQKCAEKPEKHDGLMMKRRKWPLKGWHKRYFTLDNGILMYGKSPVDIQKGKLHGAIDIGLSVLTYKRHGRRIDIDAEDLIYHLKVKTPKAFETWLDKLRHHRLYRQHEIAFGTKDAPKLLGVTSSIDDFSTPVTSPVSPNVPPFERSRGSFKQRSLERSQTKVTAWLMDSQGMEKCSKELSATQAKIFELGTLLENLRHCSLSIYNSNDLSSEYGDLSSSTAKRNKKTHGWKYNRKDKKSQDKIPVVPNGTDKPPIHTSSSNPNLVTHETERQRPVSMPEQALAGHDVKIQEMKLREDFLDVAKTVHDSLKGLSRTITTERERLKHTLEQEDGTMIQGNASYIMSLRQTLGETMKQNQDLRARLGRICDIAGSREPIPAVPETLSKMHSTGTLTPRDVNEQVILAASGSWESNSEFYDAAEYLGSSEESSEEEDDEDVSSDISDTENTQMQTMMEGMDMGMGRRCKLPVPKPDTGDVSLWSLLCKNIGKDLSKICMPVTLNEPLSMLQRLCEELEYTELIDKAADTQDPYQRMMMVAAFSVSPYAATYYRAGQKPFNPILGETYECIREDKGWRFMSEQVSHHPPISACYCESKNFVFWQDTRIKTKFWGKSMEVQPVGKVNLTLPKYQDHYVWNKATTTVHNLLGGQRWVEHNGEVLIHNQANGIKCKLTYAKSSYWSDKRYEVYGSIFTPEGKVAHQLFGKWNEGLYCGHAPSAKSVWRPGSMPEDFDLYYGFTRFAMELNEIDPDQVHIYAPTDTRFRPDQRHLEEGRLAEAEKEKLRVESLQRTERKKREEEKVVYSPKWFMRSEDEKSEAYKYTGKYWDLRKDPGFLKMQFPKLW